MGDGHLQLGGGRVKYQWPARPLANEDQLEMRPLKTRDPKVLRIDLTQPHLIY